MSNTLAIAAVTAALRDILNDVASPMPGDPDPDPELADAHVTLHAPHQARKKEEKNQLNLFLFRTAINPTFRNMDMQDLAKSGETHRQPLALNLHYLITAYGRNHDELLAHRVLGRAMSILHEQPVIPASRLAAALAGSDLSGQFEHVRITPYPLSSEEISKLWAAFSENYRISVAYEVSVVLIQPRQQAVAPLPVLRRGRDLLDQRSPRVRSNLVPPYPTLEVLTLPGPLPTVFLGDALAVTGHDLEGTALTARLDHRLFTAARQLPIAANDHSASGFRFTFPTDASQWPAGAYSLTALVTRMPTDQNRVTGALSLLARPSITSIAGADVVAGNPPTATRAGGSVRLTVDCAPAVWAGQRVALLVGDREVPGATPATPAASLDFEVRDPPLGIQYLRLRVDGIDSNVIDFGVTPPGFNAGLRLNIV
jgi:uncharacterized protein DUF4255